MKHVAQNYRTGELAVLDVPEPACLPGGVLVRTLYSLISTGTELMKVSEARLSLVGKAKARPDQVRKVLDSVAQQGPAAAYRKAMGKLDSYTPLGYSLCGVVIEVGAGAEEFAVGDLVACAGNEFALHAEVNWVPTNLCVPVPEGVAPEHAAFATVGAIAMQGVRRGEVQLGETAAVIGLGLVGQLVVRLLVAAGVRVVGVDTVADRCRLAEKAGAVLAAGPDGDGVDRLQRTLGELTGGPVGGGAGGADHVFLAAGGPTNGPVELAVQLARDRARVVDIGKTRLDLPWTDYYEKELDVRFSRSYGPGRYDDRYELDGVDYPVGYVRWTERRNLGCFLDLVAGGSLDVGALIDGVHPIADAAAVYERLRSGELTGIGILFDYPAARPDQPARATEAPHTGGTGRHPRSTGPAGRVGIGFVGAGSYASSMLLPRLARDATVDLRTVATTRSLSAANAQRSFGFQRASTDPEDVLSDPVVAAVFVVTRHHSHTDFVCRALEAGKAVFVEKPLALTYDEVDRVVSTVARTGNDRLMVGFNRRFAPLLGHVREGFVNRGRDPLHVRYLVNAGTLSGGSWYLDSEREGSRWVGEGGHFVDTVSHLVGADPAAVVAIGAGDNRHVTLEYPDGSVGVISYLTTGSGKFPKETLDVTGGGCSARLDNFVRATVWQGRARTVHRSLLGQDKGQSAQLAAFLTAVHTGAPMPVPLGSLVATARATLAGAVPGRTETDAS